MNIQGAVTLDLSETLFPEVVRLAREQHCFCLLVDAREAELKLSIADIYRLPALLVNLGFKHAVSVSTFKRALVVREMNALSHFFETTSGNRGQKIRIFQDAELAREWLLQP